MLFRSELRENDVDIRNKTIFISGEIAKGRKDRYVDSEYMFATNRGTKYQIHSFEKHIRNYIKRIKIDKQITPHTLRNNFAKRFLMGGGDIYTLSKLLGHSSIRVTEQAYLDLTTTDIRKYE